MIINKTEKHFLKDTLNEVERLAGTYADDMKEFKDYTILQMFNFISQNVEYKKDPPGIELVMRPLFTLKRGAGDCDDKAVLFLAWCKLKNYKCGYSIVSQKKEKSYHHIFTYLIINNQIIDADATYHYNKLGQVKPWEKRLNFNFI